MSSRRILVGADIGFKDTKLVWLDGTTLQKIVFPSMAAADATCIDTDGTQQGAYRIGNTVWTVGAEGQSTQFEGFPFSPQTRALFHHALRCAGFQDCHIKVASCIPMSLEYKLDGTLNKANIAEKRNNLTGACEWLPSGSVKVDAAGVLAEGLAAWNDYLYDINGNMIKGNIHGVVIDIGGNTLDMSSCRGKIMDITRSGSENNCGIYRAIDDLKKHLDVKFNGLNFSRGVLSQALSDKTITIFGEKHDIQREVDSALERTASFIKAQIDIRVGSLHEFSTILCVGGGANLFYEHLKTHFPNIEKPEDPSFSNAIGCLKKLIEVDNGDRKKSAPQKTTVKEPAVEVSTEEG